MFVHAVHHIGVHVFRTLSEVWRVMIHQLQRLGVPTHVIDDDSIGAIDLYQYAPYIAAKHGGAPRKYFVRVVHGRVRAHGVRG